MKKIILSVLALVLTLVSFAQDSKRSGYIAKSSIYKFDESKTNLPMQGYYILKNGTETEAIIAYQKPEFLVGDFAASSSLVICKSLTGKPMDVFNPDSEPNFKAFIKKEDLKAFFIDGHLYANIDKVGWRIVLNEGAIHDYIKVEKTTRNGKDYYVHFKRKQWFQDEPFGSALASISKDNHVAMLEKVPPTVSASSVGKFKKILADYNANLISLNEAEVRYNLCFDNNSEMLIDYILGPNGLTQKMGNEAAADQAAKDKSAADKKKYDDDMAAQQNAGQNAHQASKQDPFKGRTTTVSASVASVKPEVKVKKEKFLARINRIKADGNKVGVVVRCSNINVNPKSHTMFSNQKAQFVKGSYGPIVGIDSIGAIAVEEFNNGFGTDVFELVDMKDIPYTEDGNGGKADDWWTTKYKMIIFYTYNPYYTAFVQTTGDSTNVKKEFKAQMYVKSSTFIMAAEDGQKKLKSAGTPPKAASYSSEPYLGDPSTKIYMIQDLKPLIKPLTDEQIVDQLLKNQSNYNAKFIKKNNK